MSKRYVYEAVLRVEVEFLDDEHPDGSEPSDHELRQRILDAWRTGHGAIEDLGWRGHGGFVWDEDVADDEPDEDEDDDR